MKKIVTIVGARPQFIKAAIVSHAINEGSQLKEILVHTGQHYDQNMSQIFFDELDIKNIDYQLHTGSGSHAKQTAEMLISIEEILIKENPDLVLTYGDTNSTLAGALAAAKLHIPIAHVEAGLRSFNRHMPEEINRILTDQLSEILFTPTKQANDNLLCEGYSRARIIEVGDVMYDASLYYGEKAAKKSKILKHLNCMNTSYILATIHRAENTDNMDRLQCIFSALNRLGERIRIIMPLHPRTKKILQTHFFHLLENTNIDIINPLGFLDMLMLEKNAALIITDSGGVQKEAFFYHIPCMTIRDETEWVETIELGWNKIVKPNRVDEMYAEALNSIKSRGIINQFPYGRGNAAKLIFKHLTKEI